MPDGLPGWAGGVLIRVVRKGRTLLHGSHDYDG